MAKIEQKVDDIKTDVSEIKEAIKCLDSKFAPKWVEWAVKVVLGALMTGFLGLIVYLIQKHII